MVSSLNFEYVVRILPCHSSAKDKIIRLAKSFPHAAIPLPLNVKPMSIQTMNSSADSHQATKAKCSSAKVPHMLETRLNVYRRSHILTIMHADATANVTKLIESRWNSESPVSEVEVTANLYDYGTRNRISDWLEIYGGERNKKKRYVFVYRAMTKAGFCQRATTVSQKNLEYWKAKAIEGAARVGATFLREKVGVVLTADQTYLRFHETTTKSKDKIRKITASNYKLANILTTTKLISSHCDNIPFTSFLGFFVMN